MPGASANAHSMPPVAVAGWSTAPAILEERADIQPAAVDGYDLLEVRTFGDTRMHFYRYRAG